MFCPTCPYYHEIKDPNNVLAKQGQCFFNPPVPQAMQQGAQVGMVNLRPIVTDKDFCYQHPEAQKNDSGSAGLN